MACRFADDTRVGSFRNWVMVQTKIRSQGAGLLFSFRRQAEDLWNSPDVMASGLLVCCLVVLAGIAVPRPAGWPSDNGANPLNKVHTLLTQYAIDQSPGTGDNRYATAILEGANTELHELRASDRDKGIGNKYGVNVEGKRADNEHQGTNEGCMKPEGCGSGPQALSHLE